MLHNSWTLRLNILGWILHMAACSSPQTAEDAGRQSALAYSTLGVALPTATDYTHVQFDLSSARRPANGTSCTPDSAWVEPVQPGQSLSLRLVRECDYALRVELGASPGGPDSLTQVTYTNVRPGTDEGTLISAALLSQAQPFLTITAYPTTGGRSPSSIGLDMRNSQVIPSPQGNAPSQPPAAGSTPPPANSGTPQPAFDSASEAKLAALRVTAVDGSRTVTLQEAMGSARFVLVRLTMLGCEPCERLAELMARHSGFQQAIKSPKCRAITGVYDGGQPDQAQQKYRGPDFFQEYEAIANMTVKGFDGGFPFVGIFDRQKGRQEESDNLVGSDGASLLDAFVTKCSQNDK